jgi:hypothetical protein
MKCNNECFVISKNVLAKSAPCVPYPKNHLIPRIYENKWAGTTDIAAKKKIKYLTFILGCANKKLVIKVNYDRKRRYRCLL